MKKRVISVLFIILAFIITFSSLVYASWQFMFPTIVKDTSNTLRTYYPVLLGYTGQSLIDAQKVNSDGLNSNMQIGSSNAKYMLSTTQAGVVIPSLPASGQQQADLYTGYVIENTTISNGTGTLAGGVTSLTLVKGANTINIATDGNFIVVLPTGITGDAVSGTCTLTGSPVFVKSGSNTITTSAGAPGTIVVTVGTFPVIVGDSGSIAVNEDAALRLAGNGYVDIRGYLDVTGSATDYLYYKPAAFNLYVPTSGKIAAEILPEAVYENVGAAAATSAVVWGVNWYAQTFTPATTHLITSVDVYGQLVGNPAGNAYVYIRSTTAGLPDGVAGNLAFGSVVANTLNPVLAYDNISLTYPYHLNAGTTYALVFAIPLGDGGNNFVWDGSNANPYAGGQRCNSGDSGASWVGVVADDLTFREYGVIGGVVSGITSGVREILAVLDTAVTNTFSLYAYNESGALLSTDVMPMAGATVPVNVNNYLVDNGNVMPYIDYLKVATTAAYTLELWFQPNTMLIATALPDRQGANHNGTITYGTNTSITLSYGTMQSYASTASNAATTGGFAMPTSSLPSTWFASGSNLSQLPFYDSFLEVSAQTGQPLQTIYFIAIIGLAFGVFFVLALMTRSALLGILGFNIVLFVGSSQTVIPMWIPFAILIVQIGIIYLYRQVAY